MSSRPTGIWATQIDNSGEYFEVRISKTKTPAYLTYTEKAWWAFTIGRNPDLEIAGPCTTKKALINLMRQYKAEGRY